MPMEDTPNVPGEGAAPKTGDMRRARKWLFLLAAVALTAALPVFFVKPPYKGSIVSFSYSYGSFFGYREYTLTAVEDGALFTARGFNGVELDIRGKTDAAALAELASIVKENRMERWHSFSGYDDHVLDGYSFELDIAYDDGRELKASGYERYPGRYWEIHEELAGFLEGIDTAS